MSISKADIHKHVTDHFEKDPLPCHKHGVSRAVREGCSDKRGGEGGGGTVRGGEKLVAVGRGSEASESPITPLRLALIAPYKCERHYSLPAVGGFRS